MPSASLPTPRLLGIVSRLKTARFVRKINVSPFTALAHERALEKSVVKYPIDRVVTKVISVSAGQMSLQQDHLFLSQLPKKVIVDMADNRAFNGNYEKNPFNFQHFKTNYMALDVDGKLVPSKPFQPDFEGEMGKQYMLEYFTLFSQLNKLELYITKDDYAKGFTMFTFDLTRLGTQLNYPINDFPHGEANELSHPIILLTNF